MRRAAKWLAWIIAGLVGAPVLAVILVLLAANTDPGRRAIESFTPRLTGDTIRLTGLGGRFPDALRVAQLEMRDPQGAYVTVQDATLDWSPLQLLHWHVVIDRLSAGQISVIRMPASSSSGGSSGLPAPVTLNQLDIARLDIGSAIAGTSISVAVTGSAEAMSETDFHGTLDIRQNGGSGRYTVEARGDPTDLHVQLRANEEARGLLAGIAGLPDVGDIALDASLQGPRSAIATRIGLTAGPLQASAGGTIDLTHQMVDLMVSASAPAMRPRNDVAWQSVALDAHVRGPFSKPDAAGRLRVDALTAAGVAANTITADIAGNAGRLHLDGEVIGLHVPTPKPDLLSDQPLVIHADARLDAPERPVHVTVQHKLFDLDANATVGTERGLNATLNVPDLAPFAAMNGLDLTGATSLTLHAAIQGDVTTVTADGKVAITGGMQQARALVGDNGQLHLAAALHGSDLTLSKLQFNGHSIAITADGTVASNLADLGWTLQVNDLAAADLDLSGQFQATGKVTGPTDNLALTGEITGGVGARGLSSGDITINVTASGLPKNPSGHIGAQGTLLDSPINVAIAMQRKADGVAVDVQKAEWKSFQAQGSLQLPTATMVPAGNLHIVMRRLADLEPLLGRTIAGSVDALLDASTDKATLTVKMDGAALAGTAAASRVALDATVEQPVSHPTLNARLDVDGIKAASVAGSLRATANGPADAIATKLVATLDQGTLDAAATVDTVARTVSVASLQAEWRKQTIRLLAPVRVAFDNGVAFDRLRLGLRQAVLDVSGRVGSTLDITASLRNLPANIATIVAPEFAADGVIEADAHVTGTSARPAGKLRFAANGLRASSGPGRAMPPANIAATATLDGAAAQVDARVTAGRSHLSLTGRAPLSAAGSLDLRANGLIDLAVADPILSASGRRVRGQMTIDLTVTGPAKTPAFAGTARLADGEVQDYGIGVHLSDIAAEIQGSGNSLRIARLTAKAGPGTVALSGTIGALAPGLPVDLTLTAHNAVPLASDMITATMDANLAIRGQAAGELTVGGAVQVQRAEIRVPERMPAAIAVLPVRQAGSKPPPAPPPAAASVVTLNLTIDAPQQIFVRGRGLDSEFAGKMQVTGSLAAPRTVGALHMRRGTAEPCRPHTGIHLWGHQLQRRQPDQSCT